MKFTCDADFNKCASFSLNILTQNTKNPLRLTAIKAVVNLIMQLPFDLSKIVFYYLSLKDTIMISSLPRAPDLELLDDITIVGISYVTARTYASRS